MTGISGKILENHDEKPLSSNTTFVMIFHPWIIFQKIQVFEVKTAWSDPVSGRVMTQKGFENEQIQLIGDTKLQ